MLGLYVEGLMALELVFSYVKMAVLGKLHLLNGMNHTYPDRLQESDSVISANITHNLGRMADAAGIYGLCMETGRKYHY